MAGGTEELSNSAVAAHEVGLTETRLPVTFVVLTKNEERDLGGCLDSILRVSDDVHVLDSGSTDRTADVAASKGVAVHVHEFEGFGTQRNWAIDHIPHRYDWVFHLDADERFTQPLVNEIAAVLANRPGEAGFFVPSKLLFYGHWLKYAGGYPTYQVRLFHRRRLRFTNHGHGQREVSDGQIGFLREPYLHDAFSKGIDHWFRKHIDYARHEADTFRASRSRSLVSELSSLLKADRIVRRRALKSITFRLPGRATLRFWETLLFKRAFLDGRAGVAYAKMLAAYEAMTAVYLELQQVDLKGTDPVVEQHRRASTIPER